MRPTHLKRSTLAFALCCAALLPPVPRAATIVVTGPGSAVAVDGECSLVEAITAANSNTATSSTATDECSAGDPGLDTIELIGNVILEVPHFPGGVDGLPPVESEIVINGNGHTIQRDLGTPFHFRILYVGSSGILSLNSVTLSNGSTAQWGGGIYNDGVLVLTNSTVTENFATGYGGGIFNDYDLTLNRSLVSDNEAQTGGGGISNFSIARQGNSTVSGNNAPSGAGIYSIGRLDVSQSTINNNAASLHGGGIYNTNELTLTDSTVSGNGAGVSGGGIFNASPYYTSINLTSSTITDNTNSGIWNDPDAVVEIQNTIIAENRSGPDCDGPLISQGHNLAGDGSCALFGSGDLPNTAPRLDSLQDNGGPTRTHALLPGSPAIDAGDDAGCPANDQRGAPRPTDGNGDGIPVCDIGAYEFPELPLQPNTALMELPAAVDYPDNPALAYVMLGSPLTLDDPDPLTVLDSFGKQDAFTWRLFHEDAASQQPIEFLGGNGTDFNFERGRGYWLVANEGGTLELTGTPGDPAQPFTFHLEPGWNQIATPFNLNIDWSGCVVRPNSVSDALIGYDGSRGGFFDVNNPHTGDGIMRPLGGYLVHADSHADLSIPAYCAVPTTRSARSEAKSTARAQFSATDSPESGWRLKLSVAVGRTRDENNYLGVDATARDSADPLDTPEPPPMHGLSLYFPRLEWNTPWPYYATDIRSARSNMPQAWSFQVWSGLPDARVELRWEHLGALPEGIVLRDVDANRLIPVDRQGIYTFDGSAGGVRHFEVSVP